jgi:hypothetical protein
MTLPTTSPYWGLLLYSPNSSTSYVVSLDIQNVALVPGWCAEVMSAAALLRSSDAGANRGARGRDGTTAGPQEFRYILTFTSTSLPPSCCKQERQGFDLTPPSLCSTSPRMTTRTCLRCPWPTSPVRPTSTHPSGSPPEEEWPRTGVLPSPWRTQSKAQSGVSNQWFVPVCSLSRFQAYVVRVSLRENVQQNFTRLGGPRLMVATQANQLYMVTANYSGYDQAELVFENTTLGPLRCPPHHVSSSTEQLLISDYQMDVYRTQVDWDGHG